MSTMPSAADVFAREEASTEFNSRLLKAMRTLTFREREIIKLRYGMGDGFTYTLEQVARIFKVTRERVRYIQKSGLSKLKRLLSDDDFRILIR